MIFVIVAGALTYIVFRFRARASDDGEPRQIYGNKALEWTWTFIPLGIVTLLTVLMTRSMLETHSEPAQDRRPDIVVTGHQWWWEVRYPSGVVTANEVHVPVGVRSLVRLDAADVIHDFWVPELGPKEDMVPGQHNFVWLEPEQPGVYTGACAEFCGNEHGWMRIRVIAQTPQDFDAWQKAEAVAFTEAASTASPATASPAPAESASPLVPTPSLSASAAPSSSPNPDAQAPMATRSGLQAQGAALFAGKTCINCHRGPDMTSGPNVAPDLTWLGDRLTLGAGVMQNNPQTLADWLRNPQQFKPQCYMPNFHLTEDEVQALTAYLWRKSR